MNSQDFRSLQEAYMEVYHELDEGAAGDVAARAYKLASQRKGQTPERKKMYGDLFHKASARERKPHNTDWKRQGLTQKQRDSRREIDVEYSDETGLKNSTDGPGTITKNKRKLAQQKARGQHAEQYMDEAQGSYGQTPKADAAYTALATGKGKSKTKSLALKHAVRSAADRYKSDKPYSHRSKMTQSDRDYHRGQSENHGGDREGIDYDEFDTGASGPGGKPKGKKLERQKKTGVSAESYDYYDIILSHLLDEGYADTEKAAEAIMVNMSEEWIGSIVG